MTKFYKEKIQLFRLCRVCGVEYRSPRIQSKTDIHLCIVHRREFHKDFYPKYGKKYYDNLSPEKKKLNYEWWLNWIAKNLERRRLNALNSYHRRKYSGNNKARKHRATKV